MQFLVRTIWTLCLATTLVGCGGMDDLASVQGRVTLDGKPLEGAQVVFAPVSEGATSYGRTDSNGNYVMMFSDKDKGAWLGENIVQISTEDVGTGDSPATKELLPAMYHSRSTLRANVEKKANTFNFDLDSSAGRVIQSLTE